MKKIIFLEIKKILIRIVCKKGKQMNSFSVIKLLGRGTYSECFLAKDNNGEEFVWKKPIDKTQLSLWLRNCRKEACITSYLSQSNYDVAQVDVSYHKKQWNIKSKLITGIPLKKETLDILSPKERKYVIEALAKFLFDLHSSPINRTKEHFSKPRVYNWKALWEKMIAFKKTYISSRPRNRNIFQQKKFLRKKIKIYGELNFTNNQISMTEDIFKFINKNRYLFHKTGVCYNDFHGGNIFYNPQKKRLGILDFGSCSYHSPLYREFARIYEDYLGKKIRKI